MLVEIEDPDMGILKNIGVPVKLSRTPGRIRRRAPHLGEHTQEVLLQAGYTAEDVELLRKAALVHRVGLGRLPVAPPLMVSLSNHESPGSIW